MLLQVTLDRQLRDWSHLRLLKGGDGYDCDERDDENADHGHLLEMIVLFIKIQYVGSRWYNTLSSTGDPGLSASKLVSPLPLPGGYDYGECGGGDAYANHGD